MNVNKKLMMAALVLAVATSCKMENPLLSESPLPYGAPQFDKIRNEHYIPAFEQGIKEGKEEIDAIVANPEAPTFENTIEALENAGSTLVKVESIFYNVMEADTDDEKQAIAEEIAPKLTEYELYITLNPELFNRVKAVYEAQDSLNLEQDQKMLLEKTYKSFVRNGANLSEEDKKTYGQYSEELSLLTLQFSKNALAATNAYALNLTDSADLAGLPKYMIDLGAQTAQEKGQEGWTFDLSYPSYGPFMQYSTRRELRKAMYMAYNTRAVGGENDNLEVVKKIVELRIKISNLLGYTTYADYALENKMARNLENVNNLLEKLLVPSLPAARKDVEAIANYAKENGFEDELQSWDFSYWSEALRKARYNVSDEMLKPYFQLENCIEAVFGLATRLYGITFEERSDIPGYHKDVKVYDVKDSEGKHIALFYADFFPRASKRSGAWMTSFADQKIVNGVEYRPFINLVTNFSKPTAEDPSLLTHDELETFLHEFGHSLHGMLAEGRYGSLTGTSVARDFVELPSQIMENWAYEPEYLEGFAKHYKTGEVIPAELIDRIVAAKNYNAAYAQVRQLQYGILDMAWHTLTRMPEEDTKTFEKSVLAATNVIPSIPETCISTAFSHIFAGGYSAGYYSYKWSEVLEADAFSLFKEKGIFNTEVSGAFRKEILSRGSTEDEAVLYRNFRGHDPEPEALLRKLGIIG